MKLLKHDKNKKTKNRKINKNDYKKILNNILSIIKNFFKDTKKVIKENKLMVLFIIGNTLNAWLLRTLTIGNWYSLAPLLADLVISIIIGSFSVFFKKNKFVYLMTMTVISVIINLGNMIYYIYYSSFISITFISFALTNSNTGDANVLGSLFQPKVFLFLWFLIYMIAINCILKKEKTKIITFDRKKILIKLYIWAGLLLGLFLILLKPIDYSRFYKQWNREYLVSRFGVYLYQMNDVVKSVEPQMASLFGSDKANKEITEFYEEEEKEQETSSNKYTGILEGKNIIAIHAESMQNAVIGLKINDQLVAPNLTRLSQQGLYFSNFHSQVSFGTSSDTEFTLATSLMPVSSGTVFINYSDKTYLSLYNKLKDKGYYTFSMHANTGDFWNRNIMHKNLGYADFYDKSSYKIDETIGFGLSDRSFILQSVEKIKKISEEHDHYYGTMITLSNHTPFDYNELFGEFDVSMIVDGVKYPYLEKTKLGNYFKSVHYADAQIGLLIEELEKNNLLNNTIIMIYGDHDARIPLSEWNKLYNYDYKTNDVLSEKDTNYTKLDYYWQEINRKVPLIMWTNDQNLQKSYSQEVTDVMGMYDVMPTLANMMNFSCKYALGHDIFEIGSNNVVIFPNGNFITNYVYYNDNKEEYKLLKDIPLPEDYIEKYKNYTQKRLKISDSIIIYDYFKKLNSNEKYEVEQ